MLKYELQNILCSNGEVKYGAVIQTILRYLKRSQSASSVAQNYKQSKRQETEKLRRWIDKNQFWAQNINPENFISAGAEQKVYLFSDKEVIKLNDAIYYASWIDYFYSLLINNYFFPNTAYELLGFYKENELIYSVVKQQYIRANQPTSLENVREFMKANGFECVRNNDYKNAELGIILEDLHDENVLTYDGVLYFIDTVFYLTDNFWNN